MSIFGYMVGVPMDAEEFKEKMTAKQYFKILIIQTFKFREFFNLDEKIFKGNDVSLTVVWYQTRKDGHQNVKDVL